jgi:hypothetical protein
VNILKRELEGTTDSKLVFIYVNVEIDIYLLWDIYK